MYVCVCVRVCTYVCVHMCVCSVTMKYTVLSRIMAWAFIPLQQLFTIYLNFNFLCLFETQHLILLDPRRLNGTRRLYKTGHNLRQYGDTCHKYPTLYSS